MKSLAKVSGTLSSTTTPNDVVDLDVSELGGVGIQLTGTFVGTLQFKGSVDGVNFVALKATPAGSSTAVTSATAVGGWQASCAGLLTVRVQMSAWTSGAAVITLLANEASLGGAGGGSGGGGGGDASADNQVLEIAALDELTAQSLDYATGAGTAAQVVMGIALPANAGPVAGGTATNPIRTDPTGTTDQPVSWASAQHVIVDSGGGGGTQYTEDAAAAADPVGTVVNLVRKDTPSATVSADGDNIAQRGSNFGAAYVTLLDTSGSYVSAGAGTAYTEDAAAASDPVGSAQILVRKDTPSATVSADGDNIAQRGTDFGAAYVTLLDADGVPFDATNPGALNVTIVGDTAGATADTEDGTIAGGQTDVALVAGLTMMWDGSNWKRVSSATPMPVSLATAPVLVAGNANIGDVDVASIAAGNNNIGDVDVASIAAGDNNIGNVDIVSLPALVAGSANIGDVDVLTVPTDPFGANADAGSATGSISAKLRFIAATGIPITGTVTVASHAVTNAGTFLVQENGTQVQVDDAAFTPATSKIVMAGAEFDDAAPDSVDEGDGGAIRMSANRNLYVRIRDNAGNERGLNVDANGAIAATITAASGALASGSVASGALASGSVASGAIASGAIAAGAIAAGATSIAENEDVASADGDRGVKILAVRKATPANVSGTDGDYEFLQVSAGRLWVDPSGVTLTVASHAVSVASGGIASGGIASGAIASGAVASGAVASGAFAAGSIAAGAVAAGASSFVKLEDVASADADAGVPAMAVRKATPANVSGTDGDYEFLQISAGKLWVQDPKLNDAVAGEYETVAASQTAQVLGPTGATGDFVSGVLVIPATTSPGNVLLLDNATSITIFTGGSASVSNLVPFFIPLGMYSVSGAWKLTTGANVSCIGVGNFT